MSEIGAVQEERAAILRAGCRGDDGGGKNADEDSECGGDDGHGAGGV